MDEGAGKTVGDRGPSAGDGQLHAVTWCAGRAGGGLQFGGAGTDSYVEVPDSDALQLRGPFAIQFWWQKRGDDVQILVRKGNGASANYYGYLEGGLHFVVRGTDGRDYRVSAPAPANGWHHLAFVYDGDSLGIRVDDEAVGKEKVGDVRLFTDDSPLRFGTYAPGYKWCLGGVLDELCISTVDTRPEALAADLALARTWKPGDRRAATFAPTDGGVLVLARDGKPGATIVVAAGAGPLQTVPARELQAYLFRISGARLPVRDDSEPPDGNLVLVGRSRFTEAMLKPGESPPAGDGYVIRAAPGRLLLLGHDATMAGDDGNAFRPGLCKWGTANAVYAFLQDTCGVRWFMPGRLGEVVPQKTALEVPAMDVQARPARTYALGSLWQAGSATWARRNGLGSAVFIRHMGGHLWYSLIPEKTYFPEHPEWFALHNGLRDREGNHLCTSNPALFAEALKNLEALYAEGYEWVELGQADGYQRCQCPACEALDGYREAGWWVPEQPADRIHGFHARLAEGVRKAYPGRRVEIIAYGPTGEVPQRLERFPDNVVVEFTHDPPVLLERWNRFHDRFAAYVYWFGLYQPLHVGPKSSPTFVARELRRLRAARAEAFFLCGGGECWGTEALSYYTAARLIADPSLDARALQREFCAGLFGTAAPIMDEFLTAFYAAADTYRSLTTTTEVKPGVPFMGKSQPPGDLYLACFDEAALASCARLLERALAAAPGEPGQRRTRFFQDGFEYVRWTALAFRRAKAWEAEKSIATRAALDEVLRQREAFVAELLQRQGANGSDLPPVLDASREALLYGPAGEYKPVFGRTD